MNDGTGWTPIRDYERDPASLARKELTALADVWNEQRTDLANSDLLADFNRKLHREWAIETGLIERVYDFDRGVTELLVEHGIDATLIPHGSGAVPEVAASMIRDHEAAIDFVFACVKDERPLSTSYINELHQLLTRHQETAEGRDSLGRRVRIRLAHGTYKTRPNNPIGRDGLVHHYCPPEQVASEMDRLLAMHREHDEVAPEVEAAWLHHRFVQIHPFQDGNGRVARALATLVLVKAGRFPLVVRSEAKPDYIAALEAADRGDLDPLVRFFSEIQKEALVGAIGLPREVTKTRRADEFIRATRRQLERRRDLPLEEWNTAKDRAGDLRGMAADRLEEVRQSLETELSALIDPIKVFVDQEADQSARSHHFRIQIVEVARALRYFAGLDAYRSWVRLVIQNADQSQILFSFHAIGHEFRGVLVCSALFFERQQTAADARETGPAKALCPSIFQINYREDPEEIRDRFRSWLEDCIVNGLEAWRESGA